MNRRFMSLMTLRRPMKNLIQKSFEKFGYKAEKTTKEAKIPVHENEECDNM